MSGFSLRRWSARKRAARGVGAKDAPVDTATANRATDSAAAAQAPAASAPAVSQTPASRAGGSVAQTGAAAPIREAAATELALPPIDTLTPQSDFTPFMRPEVAPSLRSAALRKLFADPRFNVMDGLDVYIDDYTKADPIAPDLVKKLWQARHIFAPPPTRVNPQGIVEDVPKEELAQAASSANAKDDPPATPELAPESRAVLATALPDDAAPRQKPLPLDAPPETKP